MIVLGLSGALRHDASAALVIDGETIAAAEEERFTRDKHAKNQWPEQAARYCLAQAGMKAEDVDCVAFPYAPISLFRKARWVYAARYWYAPDRALDALLNGNRRFRSHRRDILSLGERLGINWDKTRFVPVEHHLSHASSAYHLSGLEGKTAILGVDGKGEYATTFFGYGENGQIHTLKEFYDPDSLGGVYGALTEYLGFEMLDGEYKVMGMAPYGDRDKYDLSRLIQPSGDGFRANTRYVNVVGLRRHKDQGQAFYFSDALIDWLGPRRRNDDADEPYVHYAAAMQRLYEDWVIRLTQRYLGDVLNETRQLVFAGGGALNVKLNQRLLGEANIDHLYVQPASGDSGTALGAATFVANQQGDRIAPLRHVYLGPSFSGDECLAALQKRSETCHWQRMDNPLSAAADILTDGHPLAWFQGRMEFGPRALGGRSILGCPSTPGIADKINAQIKFRERWRPFCPSVLPEVAAELIQPPHPAPYMTMTFDVAPAWRERIPEVVHEDGTARVQVVDEQAHPRYHQLLQMMQKSTGNGVLLNTSLNRRGEPMVCSPDDALNMFFGCDLQYLLLEDFLVTKEAR